MEPCMPAIITHDQFGKQALSLSSVLFIKTKEEKDAETKDLTLSFIAALTHPFSNIVLLEI